MRHSRITGITRWRRQLSLFSALLALGVTLCLFGAAQTNPGHSNPQDSHPPANINTPHQLVITGCLRRDSNGAYSLTSENGKTWNLIAGSDSVDLSKHVFHAVKITGKEASSAQPTDGGDNPQTEKLSTLRVLTLEVLSRSCTR